MAASFVFTRAHAPERARLDSWLDHAQRVAGVAPYAPAPASDGYVVWHLAAANHRVLARGVGVFATPEEAHADALAAAHEAETMRVRLVKNGALGEYGWFLADASRARVTCSRWYATERDRRDAIRLAVEALLSARAVLEEGPAPRARIVGRVR